MDCPNRIPTPLQEHQHHTTRHPETATPDQALDTTRKTEKEETGPDHSLDIADTAAPAIVTCTEAAPDHNNGAGSATIEAAQDKPIQHIKDTVAGPIITNHTFTETRRKWEYSRTGILQSLLSHYQMEFLPSRS